MNVTAVVQPEKSADKKSKKEPVKTVIPEFLLAEAPPRAKAVLEFYNKLECKVDAMGAHTERIQRKNHHCGPLSVRVLLLMGSLRRTLRPGPDECDCTRRTRVPLNRPRDPTV
eukprot:sb/3476946/